MKRVLALLAAVFVFFGSAPKNCRAHDIHLTGVKLIWSKKNLLVSVLTPASRLKTSDYKNAIAARLKLRFDGRDFQPRASTLMLDKPNDMAMWQATYPRGVARIEVLSRLYPEDPNSREIVTVFREGRLVQETILDADHPDFIIGEHQQNAAPLVVAGRFVREGILHIFGGPDHILFILGLLLLGGSIKSLLKTITAFTLAHSITLTLAATGVLTPSPRLVEPLIALSIIAVAWENLRHRKEEQTKKQTDWRPLIAFGFGLIHGFGFAGALAEVGLPRAALGWALASFNVGVEIGQATIVFIAAPLLSLLARHRSTLHRRVVFAGSCIIAAAGLFWFVQRVSGA